MSGRVAPALPVGPDDVRVPVPAPLHRAPLRLVVDVHEAEALVVAIGPLEVVEQRPGEVSGEGDALAGRRGTGGEVLLQVPRALGAVDGAVGAHDVGIGGAVLGDVQLAGAVVV